MNKKMSIKGILSMAIVTISSLMFLNMSLAATMAKVSVETANLRESASSDSGVVEQISQDEEVEVLENAGEWSKVKYKEATGYIKTELLNISETEEQTTEENATTEENQEQEQQNNEEQAENNQEQSQPQEEQNQNNTEETKPEDELGKYFITEDLKIKLIPLINATDMIELKKDQEVNVTKIINGWAYLEVEGSEAKRGWVRIEKIKDEGQKKADDEAKAAEEAAAAQKAAEEADKNAPAIKTSYVQTETVNLRKEKNTTSEILGRIPKNTGVEVIAEEGEWSKCRTGGLIGYISTQYLGDSKKEDEEVTSRGATQPRTAATPVAPAAKDASSVISYAQGLLGHKYVSGGKGPEVFDCSGFTQYVFKQFGVSLGGSTYTQINNGTAVDRSNLAPGDLVFFNNNGHVGIYMGNDRFIHAANSKRGVVTDSFSGYGGFYAARRVM